MSQPSGIGPTIETAAAARRAAAAEARLDAAFGVVPNGSDPRATSVVVASASASDAPSSTAGTATAQAAAGPPATAAIPFAAAREETTYRPPPAHFSESDVPTPGPPAAAPAVSGIWRRLFPGEGDAEPGEAAAPAAGCELGHFVVEERIGAGGMGAVFRALDTRLDRVVALKILSPGQSRDRSSVLRFENEARAAARLDHENVARVFYVGEERGLHFIAFEYVVGQNVRDLITRTGRLTVADAVSITLQVAAALRHAAAAGVVHRDVKPSNIIVTPSGRAKLVDLGLARKLALDGAGDLTIAGTTLGTFDYISPEQARDPRVADARSDIYSLGCTLYHMLTGNPPYRDGTVLQKLLDHQSKEAPDPRQSNPQVPAALAAICRKMMASAPGDRHATPEDLMRELARLAASLGMKPLPADGFLWTRPTPPRPPAARSGLVWAASAVVVLLLALAVDRLPYPQPAESPPRPLPSAAADLGLSAAPPSPSAVADVGPTRRPATTAVASTTNAGQAPSAAHAAAPPAGSSRPNSASPVPSLTPENGRPAAALAGADDPAPSGDSAAAPEPVRPPRLPSAVRPFEPTVAALLSYWPAGWSAENWLPTPPGIALAPPGPAAAGPSVPPSAAVGEGTAGAPVASVVGEPDTLPPNEFPDGPPATALLVPSVGAARRYASLAAAVEAAAVQGDAIELLYDGLPEGRGQREPLHISRKSLTIRAGKAADGRTHRPLLDFDAERLPAGETAMIAVSGGQLTIENVDLRLTVSGPADQWSLFSLPGGERVRLDGVNITLVNPKGLPLTVFDLRPPARVSTQMTLMMGQEATSGFDIEIRRCLIRGGADLATVAHTLPGRLTVRQSALALGYALLNVKGGADAPLADDAIVVELDHVTAVVGQGLLGMEVEDRRAVRLDVTARNNVFTTTSAGPFVLMSGGGEASDYLDALSWTGERNAYEPLVFTPFWSVFTADGPAADAPATFEKWKAHWDKPGTTTEELRPDVAGVPWEFADWRSKTLSDLTGADLSLDAAAAVRMAGTDGRPLGVPAAVLPPRADPPARSTPKRRGRRCGRTAGFIACETCLAKEAHLGAAGTGWAASNSWT